MEELDLYLLQYIRFILTLEQKVKQLLIAMETNIQKLLSNDE